MKLPQAPRPCRLCRWHPDVPGRLCFFVPPVQLSLLTDTIPAENYKQLWTRAMEGAINCGVSERRPQLALVIFPPNCGSRQQSFAEPLLETPLSCKTTHSEPTCSLLPPSLSRELDNLCYIYIYTYTHIPTHTYINICLYVYIYTYRYL